MIKISIFGLEYFLVMESILDFEFSFIFLHFLILFLT